MVAACALAFAQPASAEDAAVAGRLFEEAKRLASEGRWADACPLLAESLRLEANLTTEFRLAACYEQTGRNASAWVHYDAVATAATAAGEPAKAQFARERATRLAPSADRILIVPPVGEVHVDYDGREIPRKAWTVPLPMDPGEHTVHVWAPGMFSYDTLVNGSGQGRLVRLSVPPLEPAPIEATNNKPAAAPLATSDIKPPPPQKSSLRPVGLGIGIAGMALLAGGTALYMESRIDKSSQSCGAACVGGVGMLSLGGAALIFGTLLFIAGSSEN